MFRVVDADLPTFVIFVFGLVKSSHYSDVIMGAIAYQSTSLTIVYSTAYSDVDQSLCAEDSPGTAEFPAQMASNAENVSIWWRHHGNAVT